MFDFKGAIFDLDGTVADSNPVWEKIDRIYLKNHGISVSDREITRFSSLTYEECAAEFAKLGIKTDVPSIMSEFNRLAVIEYRTSVMLKHGAEEYLRKLKSEGKPIALATASPASLYEPVLLHHNIYSLFDAFCTTDDVARGKGFPDIYILAASKIGVPVSQCAVFEDTLNGVIGAKNARAFTVGVYDKASYSDKDEIMKISDLYINSFDELL